MPSFETTMKVEIICVCGTHLEQLPGPPTRNSITVKPCQVCTQAYRLDAAISKKRLMEIGSVKQVSRRGVLVDERST
jgi:hypothetical protein